MHCGQLAGHLHSHPDVVRPADSVGATVSVIGFAFYLQPIAMPMLREMPPGEAGYKMLSFCMRTVIMGTMQSWRCKGMRIRMGRNAAGKRHTQLCDSASAH